MKRICRAGAAWGERTEAWVSVTPFNSDPDSEYQNPSHCPNGPVNSLGAHSPRPLDTLAMMRIIVAERARTLAALHQSDSQFRTAFDRAPIGMALVSLEGRWLQVNQSLCRMVGYAYAEMLTRDFQSLTHPEDIAPSVACLSRLKNGDCKGCQFIKRYLHRDGHIVWVQVSLSLVSEGAKEAPYIIAQIEDITEQRQAEDRLRASEEEYRTMFELAGVGKAERDCLTGQFVRVNQKFCEITGYSSAELLAMRFGELTHPEDQAASSVLYGKLARGEVSEFTIDKRYVRKDGRTIWVCLNVAGIRDKSGRVVRSVGTIQDTTERKRAEWVERDRRQVLEMVAQNMPLPGVLGRLAEAVERQVDGWAAFMIVRDGALNLHAPSFPSGWRDAVVAHLMSVAASLSSHAWDNSERCGVSFFATDPAWTELRAHAAELGLQSCWTVAIQSNDGSSLGALSLFSKESCGPSAHDLQMLQMASSLATICVEHHNTATALAHSVRHDLLTGMPNRICFEDRLETAMQRARRDGSQVALFFLDVDRFKYVNDTFGHEAGDALLQQFASRIARQLREIDTLARMGGDEFALIIPDIKSPEDALVVAKKIMKALIEPMHVAGRDLIITTSMGIALYPSHGDDSASLQRCADQEMYRTKQRGRNGYSIAATATARRCSRTGLASAG